MTDRYFNPFQTAELRIPESFRDDVSRYCQGPTQDGRKTSLGEAPFPRMVDMWFMALCLGAKEGNRTDLSGVKMHKFMDGTVLSSDPWRIDALMLMAISLTNDTSIVADPLKIISLANEYAAGGLPRVLEMIKDGDAEAIYNLSDNLESILNRQNTEVT